MGKMGSRNGKEKVGFGVFVGGWGWVGMRGSRSGKVGYII